MQATPHSTEAGSQGESYRQGLASLLIFFQLFCLVACVTAIWTPSALQRRVLRTLAPYTRVLHLEIIAPFYFTHASVLDVDHFFEFDFSPQPGAPFEADLALPPGRIGGQDRWRRYQALADTVANFAEFDDDRTCATIIEPLLKRLMRENETDRCVLRLRAHTLQSLEAAREGNAAQRDPHSEIYFRTVYEAEARLHVDGSLTINKLSANNQSAAPAEGGARSAPPAGS